MKNFFICLFVAVITFLIGIAITSALLFFTKFPEVKVISNDFDSNSAEISKFSENKIQIEYYYTLRSKSFNNGVFVVTNNSDESIYYLGYGKNSHIRNWIRQNGIIELATVLVCANGVEEQELKPNDSAIFEIPVPPNSKPYDAGFDFRKSQNGEWQTIWVKVNESQKFVAAK